MAPRPGNPPLLTLRFALVDPDDDSLTPPAAASQVGDSPETRSENPTGGLETSVWRNFRKFYTSRGSSNDNTYGPLSDGPYLDHPMESRFRLGDPEDCSVCADPNPLFPAAKKSNRPRIDGPLALEPSSTVLHYAQTLFEGMKAYRDENGKVTLFRPDMNMKRMNTSASRLALPVINSLERNLDLH